MEKNHRARCVGRVWSIMSSPGELLSLNLHMLTNPEANTALGVEGLVQSLGLVILKVWAQNESHAMVCSAHV